MSTLAQRFAETNPVANTIMIIVLVLVLVSAVVFARPIGRFLHWLMMKAMQAHGVADPDPKPGEPRRPGGEEPRPDDES